VLCGVGLCLGYTLLGACWLVKKCEAEIRESAYRLIPYLAVGLFVFLIVVFAYALAQHLRVIGLWLDRPYLFAFPAVGAIAALVAASSFRHHQDSVPFYMGALIFAAAFGTLAISFWPYMIPFSITIDEAAAPHSSLAFMFWGEGLFVFPLMLLYTAISYTVFRGKLDSSKTHYWAPERVPLTIDNQLVDGFRLVIVIPPWLTRGGSPTSKVSVIVAVPSLARLAARPA
jgi:cytochrome bd ubiquinol oxidase subunit II